MTPEEKAKELVEKYSQLASTEVYDLGYLSRNLAIQAAELCVDEIIATGLLGKGENVQSWNLIYWQKVKEELQKL